jgi:hypothetical protein
MDFVRIGMRLGRRCPAILPPKMVIFPSLIVPFLVRSFVPLGTLAALAPDNPEHFAAEQRKAFERALLSTRALTAGRGSAHTQPASPS